MTDKYVFVSVPIALSKTLHPAFEVCYPVGHAPDSPIAVASHPAAGIQELLTEYPMPNGDVFVDWAHRDGLTIYEFERGRMVDGDSIRLLINGEFHSVCVLGVMDEYEGIAELAHDLESEQP